MSARKAVREEVKKQFASDVAEHKMTILRDDGVDRHIRFKQPDSGVYWFDIITWGGRLYIGGDCGTFVFARLHDMFEFFRTDRDINPGYWAEKVESSPGSKGCDEFSDDRFREVVKQHFDEFMENKGEDWPKERRDALWNSIDCEVLGALGDGGEQHAFAMANNFDEDGFRFRDLWDHRFSEYTHQFLWNCYAIQWAVQQYDAHKAAPKPDAGNDATFGAKAIAA